MDGCRLIAGHTEHAPRWGRRRDVTRLLATAQCRGGQSRCQENGPATQAFPPPSPLRKEGNGGAERGEGRTDRRGVGKDGGKKEVRGEGGAEGKNPRLRGRRKKEGGCDGCVCPATPS